MFVCGDDPDGLVITVGGAIVTVAVVTMTGLSSWVLGLKHLRQKAFRDTWARREAQQ